MTSSARTHLVVGGASGIGAAVVDAERAAGADVLVWDIAGAYDVKCDVTDAASIDAALE
jgi:NAD(P)-dependent dehydrogenase (short-subunit alcohol dehydrogenase family)